MAQHPDIHRIGHNIRKLRELYVYNQDYIADRLGISVRTYGKLESHPGEISLSRLYQIAEVLSVRPEKLLNMDVQQLFQNNNIAGISVQGDAYNHDPGVIRDGYDQLIEHLKEEITYLRNALDQSKL